MKICDLHTHALPGVDHGAQDMEQALQMLQNAIASEVEYVALTPHLGTEGENIPRHIEKMQQQFQKIREAAASLPVQLALGAEVHITAQLLEQLDVLELPTINGSRYLLAEFPMLAKEDFISQSLETLLQEGYIPLVAHPERYSAVSTQPWIVEQWLDMGCHIQITGGSILGHYGKNVQRTAGELLCKDLVACVASDAHGITERTNYLMGVYDHLTIQFSRQYAQCLMHTNPLKIWRDETL